MMSGDKCESSSGRPVACLDFTNRVPDIPGISMQPEGLFHPARNEDRSQQQSSTVKLPLQICGFKKVSVGAWILRKFYIKSRSCQCIHILNPLATYVFFPRHFTAWRDFSRSCHCSLQRKGPEPEISVADAGIVSNPGWGVHGQNLG